MTKQLQACINSGQVSAAHGAAGELIEPCHAIGPKEFKCDNRHQCFEPCGELGHSEEHAQVVAHAEAGELAVVAWRWDCLPGTEHSKRRGPSEGVYLEDPAALGIPMNHPSYKWTELVKLADAEARAAQYKAAHDAELDTVLKDRVALAAALEAEREKVRLLRELLIGKNGALIRMDRARAILTNDNPTPNCNWGMLDTADLSIELTATQEQK